MTDIYSLAKAYWKARGIKPKGKPTGKKLLEETGELIEAIAKASCAYNGDAVKHEVADVAISLAYIAKKNGFTIEEAILAKTEKDRDRNRVSDDVPNPARYAARGEPAAVQNWLSVHYPWDVWYWTLDQINEARRAVGLI